MEIIRKYLNNISKIMITNNQIKAMSENELAYLYYALNTEWNSLNMGYDFDWYILKAFRNNTIQNILNKHSDNLTDENKGITMEILKKLEENI
jgi:hypothetical protein